jgi:hypothetical protein
LRRSIVCDDGSWARVASTHAGGAVSEPAAGDRVAVELESMAGGVAVGLATGGDGGPEPQAVTIA